MEPHQDFPVTHLQLYSAVSHPSLVPLLAESRLGNLCQLVQEADEQGNTVLIHLQPESEEKTLLCIMCGTWKHNGLLRSMVSWAPSSGGPAHLILCSQPWDGRGWQCQHERAVPL